jgi:hypothetical protein
MCSRAFVTHREQNCGARFQPRRNQRCAQRPPLRSLTRGMCSPSNATHFLIDTPAIRIRLNSLKTKHNIFSNRHSARPIKLHTTGAIRAAFFLSKPETGVPSFPQASPPENRVYDMRPKQEIRVETPRSCSNRRSVHEEIGNTAQLKEAFV